MNETDIDFQAIVAQLQTENEALRETVMRSRLARFTQKNLSSITRQDVATVLKDKKFWIGAGIGAAFAISSGIAPYIVDVFSQLRTGK